MNLEHEFHRAIGLAKEIENRAEKAEKALKEIYKYTSHNNTLDMKQVSTIHNIIRNTLKSGAE